MKTTDLQVGDSYILDGAFEAKIEYVAPDHEGIELGDGVIVYRGNERIFPEVTQ